MQSPVKIRLPSIWLFLFFLFLKFIYNWRIIVLQYCVGFCSMSTWTSHSYIYVPPHFLEPSSHLPLHPTPLGCHRALGLSSRHYTSQQIPSGYLFTYRNIYVSQFVPPSPSPYCVHRSVHYVCVSTVSLKIGIFLDSVYIMLIYDICFSLSDLLHSI